MGVVTEICVAQGPRACFHKGHPAPGVALAVLLIASPAFRSELGNPQHHFWGEADLQKM
jgi:hypothetical protein